MEGRLIRFWLLAFGFWLLVVACEQPREHTAPAIYERDSVAMMTSYGVNTLISDSGVIKYRIVAERWEVNEARNPSRWIFDKGVLLTQFDQTFHIQSYIQCDTAYYFDKIRLWELHGRVRILTKQGTTFSSEELFWDEQKHEIWSHRFSHLKTPERELQGNYFKSDERMTKYIVTNTKGSFERADMGFGKPNPKDSLRQAQKKQNQSQDTAKNIKPEPLKLTQNKAGAKKPEPLKFTPNKAGAEKFEPKKFEPKNTGERRFGTNRPVPKKPFVRNNKKK